MKPKAGGGYEDGKRKLNLRRISVYTNILKPGEDAF
jgi:hypothetical protein